jgi:hypothetical protein
MYDIDSYLEFTRRRPSRDPYMVTQALIARGRKLMDKIEIPEEDSAKWIHLNERY